MGLALRLVQGVVAAVGLGAQGAELDDALHLHQQLAVMADQDQATAPALQLLRQPVAAVAVQVVARLVEQQQVGVAQQGADQHHASQLPAAQRGRRVLWLHLLQAGVVQGLAQALRQVPAVIHLVQVFQAGGAGGQALQGAQGLGEAGDLGHALAWLHLWVLGHIGQPGAVADAAGRGLQLAGDQAQQQGFAHAIAPDDGRGLAIETQVQGIEQGFAIGELVGQLVQGNQCGQPGDVSHQHLRKMWQQANERLQGSSRIHFWKA